MYQVAKKFICFTCIEMLSEQINYLPNRKSRKIRGTKIRDRKIRGRKIRGRTIINK